MKCSPSTGPGALVVGEYHPSDSQGRNQSWTQLRPPQQESELGA